MYVTFNSFCNEIKTLIESINFVSDPSGGTSGDWAYARLGVKLSYTIELRDLGRNGFTLPAEEMLANYEEFMAGMVALVKKAKELKYV